MYTKNQVKNTKKATLIEKPKTNQKHILRIQNKTYNKKIKNIEIQSIESINLANISPSNYQERMNEIQTKPVEIKNTKKEEKDLRSKIIKEFIKDNLANSQTHGIPKIIKEENKLVKLMWIVCVIISAITCIALVTINIMDFLRFEVNSKIRVIHELPTIFPTVTICNKNMFTTDYSVQFLKELIAQHNLPNIFDYSENSTMKYLSPLNQSNEIDSVLRLAKQVAISLNETEKRKFSPDIDELLISCIFDYRQCTKEDFIWIYDAYFGGCYIFNSGFDMNKKQVGFKTVRQPGEINALRLVIDSSVSLELKNIYQDFGLAIRIDNSSNQKVQWKEAWDLKPDLSTKISVNRIYTHQMPRPYSQCDIDADNNIAFDSDLYDLFLKANHPYKQEYCVDLCYQKLAILGCNCSDSESINLNGIEPCLTKDKIACLDRLYLDVFLNGSFIDTNCKPRCPLECKKVHFQISSSISAFSLANRFNNSTIYNKMSLVKFHVFYESLTYTVVTELKKVDSFILISSIGGTFGLFLGASFLSFLEIFEIAIESLYLYKNHLSKIVTNKG
jgi:hypothetical protein